MDGEVDLLPNNKIKTSTYLGSINSQQGQADFDIVEKKKGESRPFLKKGSGLTRFYKGDQASQYIKQLNKKTAGRVQIQEPNLDEYVTKAKEKENGNLILSSLSEVHEAQPRAAKLPLKDNTNNRVTCDGEDDPEDTELKIFEALEKATGAASFCSTSSLAARFLQTKLNTAREKEKDLESTSVVIEERSSISRDHEKMSELYSPTSSLFGSDDDDDEDEIEEEHHEEIREDEHKESSKNIKDHSVPIVSLRSPKYDKSIEKLENENTALKARIVYLEDKIEKNTLEWWSHKEEILAIVTNLQSTINRKNSQLDDMHSTFTNKMRNLEEEIQIKSKKWCENQIKMVEKVQLLEEELSISNEKWSKLKNKMQSSIDSVQKELHVKSSEWATTHERLSSSISTLENEKRERNISKTRIRSPQSKIAECVTPDAEESIFEDDDVDDGTSKILSNGDKETVYFNGTKKIIVRDKSEIRHLYTNGDIRVEKQDGTVKYFYSESSTWQTTYTNGVEFYEFPNGQTERRNPNGMIEVVFANGCVKYSHPSGTEECIFADNTILRVEANGERAVVLPNGQQEIHGSDYKKRIYPDGTIKTVYSDGSQETRYPNGRVRIKDVQGVLVSDITLSKKHSPGKSKLSPRIKPS